MGNAGAPTSKDATSAVGEAAWELSCLFWWRHFDKAHSLAATLPSAQDSAAVDGSNAESLSESPVARAPSLNSSPSQQSVRLRASRQISESNSRRLLLERVQRSVNDAILAEFLEEAARVPRGTRAFI